MRILPVDWCIKKFGGARKMAEALGIRRASVYKMRLPFTARKYGQPGGHGANGYIPTSDMQRKILKLAESNGLDITAEDLVNGRIVPDVVEIAK